MSIKKKPRPYKKSIARGSPNIFSANTLFHQPMIALDFVPPAIWKVGIPPNIELVQYVTSPVLSL